jgi:hypothetical protein
MGPHLSHHPARSRFHAATRILAAAALSVAAFAVATPAHASGNTLTVDVGTTVRPVTHVAAGGLYGVDSGSTSDWESKITTMIKARLAATSTTNIAGYELWNEPDANWTASTSADPDAGSYLDAWNRTYKDVRALDTKTPIVGPDESSYNHTWMSNFLTNAKNNGTLPDVITWHELGDLGYQNIQAHVNDFTALEDSLGISHRPISIDEYASPSQVDQPSIGVHYMASMERAGIHDGERAYWYEAGTMNGLLYNDQPTASYWAYKWYGDQSGNIVQTVPQSYLDGVASYDASRKQVNVVFGGDSGSNTVQINGLGGLGSSVHVTLSSTNTTGRTTGEAAPNTLSTTTYTVTNGSITVPVANMNAVAAYQLLITPATGTPTWQQTYEAENATVVNAIRYSSTAASNGGYVGGIDNTGDARTDSFVDFLVNVPSTRTYTLAIKYANATGATSTQGLAYDGGTYSTISYPATTSGWGHPTGTVSTTVNLTAGYNMIRLAKGAPNYAGGTGYAELDNITLS